MEGGEEGSCDGLEESGSGLGSEKWRGLSRAAAVRSKPETGECIGATTSAATDSSKRESIAFSTRTQTEKPQTPGVDLKVAITFFNTYFNVVDGNVH